MLLLHIPHLALSHLLRISEQTNSQIHHHPISCLFLEKILKRLLLQGEFRSILLQRILPQRILPFRTTSTPLINLQLLLLLLPLVLSTTLLNLLSWPLVQQHSTSLQPRQHSNPLTNHLFIPSQALHK